MSGVSTVSTTAYSAGPASIADMPARSEALIPVRPVVGHHRARSWHVDDRGAQHDHDVVAPPVLERGDGASQPSPVGGEHLGHAVAGARSRGEHDPADPACHVHSVNSPCVAAISFRISDFRLICRLRQRQYKADSPIDLAL